MIKFYFSVLCYIISISSAFAGAWTLDEGTGQYITTYRHYKTDQFYDTQGKERPKNGEFTKNEFELYLQYGITPRITAGISIAASSEEDSQQIVEFNARTNQRATSQRILQIEGLSRIEAFGRYQLYRDATYALAIQPTIKFPSLYANALPPQAQPDEWEAEAALLGGRNFTVFGRPHYGEISLAYRHRQGQLGDQWRLEARSGLTVHENFVIMPEIQLTRSIDEINRNFATLSGSNNYHLLKGQLSGVYQWNTRTALQAGIFSHLAGTNTGSGGGVIISLWRTF